MYLVSGTLFFIASFFLFLINYYINYNGNMDSFILVLSLISIFAGVSMYVKQYYQEKEEKNEK